jgi:uncharacterized protein
MDITFDPAKDAINITKHGISLARAQDLLWDEALFKEDGRKDYGERRVQALIPLGDRLHTVVFTDRGNVRRIILLQKSNQRELKTYVSQK